MTRRSPELHVKPSYHDRMSRCLTSCSSVSKCSPRASCEVAEVAHVPKCHVPKCHVKVIPRAGV
jgi:hypothetical protein